MTVFLADRPSPEWVARELAAGRCVDWRTDCDHTYRDALEAEHRDHQAVTHAS